MSTNSAFLVATYWLLTRGLVNRHLAMCPTCPDPSRGMETEASTSRTSGGPRRSGEGHDLIQLVQRQDQDAMHTGTTWENLILVEPKDILPGTPTWQRMIFPHKSHFFLQGISRCHDRWRVCNIQGVKFSDGLREPRATPFRFFPRKRRWVDREVKIFKMKQAAKKKAEKMTGAPDRFTQSKTSTNT